MDDVADLFVYIKDLASAETVGRALEDGRELLRDTVQGKYVGKAAGPLKYIPRGVDYLADQVGADQDQSVRRFLTIDRESMDRNPGIGVTILPEPAPVANTGAGAADTGPAPPAVDRVVTGVFDP